MRTGGFSPFMIDAVELATHDLLSTSYPGKNIAVLIPCYNEELTIGKVISEFRKQLPTASFYVYDNNSSDRTALIAKAAGLALSREASRERLCGRFHL